MNLAAVHYITAKLYGLNYLNNIIIILKISNFMDYMVEDSVSFKALLIVWPPHDEKVEQF